MRSSDEGSAAAVAHSAPPAAGRSLASEPCRNCDDPMHADFCPACGQRKVDVRVRLRDLIAEYLDDQFAINGRLPRTLGTLLLRPGRLTRDYLDGRIVRYVAPFRLYVVISVLFFLLVSLGTRASPVFSVRSDDAADAAGEAAAPVLEPAAEGAVPEEGPFRIDDLDLRTPWPRVTALLEQRARRFADVPPEQVPALIGRALLDRLPLLMFLLLPVLAMLLKVLYLRSGRFYVEHFIFGLHVQTFAFAILVVDRLAGQRFSDVLWIYVLVYLYLAMRRVYGESRLRTGVKYVALLGTYSFSLVIGVLGLLVLTLLVI
jgi:hypothetical protein